MSSMAKSIFFLLSMLLLTHNGDAQEYVLKLEKVRNGKVRKTKIFNEGTYLVIRTKQGRRKGVFAVKDSTSIILNGGEIIKLEDIKKFRQPNGKLIGGLTLTITGGLTFIGGFLAMGLEEIFDGEDPNNNAEIATIAGLAALTAGTQLLANYNHKPVKPAWNLSIIER